MRDIQGELRQEVERYAPVAPPPSLATLRTRRRLRLLLSSALGVFAVVAMTGFALALVRSGPASSRLAVRPLEAPSPTLSAAATPSTTQSNSARGEPCLPTPLSVTPSQADPGATVTLSSTSAGCDVYREPATYAVILNTEGRQTNVTVGTVSVGGDGSFSLSISIPPDVTSGPASLFVRGSAFDRCGSDGTGSCAAYQIRLQIL
jgi:hypothetical protein